MTKELKMEATVFILVLSQFPQSLPMPPRHYCLEEKEAKLLT